MYGLKIGAQCDYLFERWACVCVCAVGLGQVVSPDGSMRIEVKVPEEESPRVITATADAGGALASELPDVKVRTTARISSPISPLASNFIRIHLICCDFPPIRGLKTCARAGGERGGDG